MAEFYIVRHGERESNREDTPLTRLGVTEAEITGEYLKKLGIKFLYSSPMKRGQQTAEIIANMLGIKLMIDPRLRERLVWGDRKGETYQEFLEEWGKTSTDRDYNPPYGESSFASGNRLKSLVDELAGISNGPHLLITHSGLTGDFLRNFFSDELLPFYTVPIADSRDVKIAECSITIVEVDKGIYTLKQINDIGHLSF